MARVLGVDYGVKRIGIAVSDFGGSIASPERVIEGRASVKADAEAVVGVAAELEAEEVVVGLPLNMDGGDSEQTKLTRAFAAALRERISRPVHLWDERLSSHAADAMLAQRGLTRKKRKARHDATAAAVILKGFLESRRKG